MKKKNIFTAIIILLSSLLLVQSVSAENAFSIYGGVAFGEEDFIHVTDLTTSPTQSFTEYVQHGDSPEIGLRYTIWGTYIGLAFDFSFFAPASTEEPEFITYEVLPLSLMLMFLWLLFKSEGAPRGRFQPYLGIGPSYVVYDFKINYSAFTSPGESDGSGSDFTLDLRAGLNWQISQRNSFFLEFRYTSVNINTGDEHDYWNIPRRIEIQTELKNRHVLIGYSFSF